ncbi:EamA family transporter [Aequorivita sp. Q41]|uniref:DMT family transporter n=1 Tax=Aequorivita sp. Q41 TaxID=3153300 RepID=UPI003241E2D4
MEKKPLLAYIALAVVCIVWGTTYFAMRIGVATFPPFLFSGIRHTIAGILMLIALKLSGRLSKLSKSDIKRQAVPGVLMVALGNGVIGWSEKYIPSGLAALIVSIMPVYVVALNYLSGADRQFPNAKIIIGLLLGSIGIVLIFKDNIQDVTNTDYLIGMLVAFGACLAWATGAIYAKHRPPKSNIITNASVQLILGGLALLLMCPVFDDLTRLGMVSSESIWSLLYLIVFGSILAYSCFVYALEKLPLGLSSIYAYFNPFIALSLGFLFLNEKMTNITILALIAALGGVYFINKGYKVPKIKTEIKKVEITDK